MFLGAFNRECGISLSVAAERKPASKFKSIDTLIGEFESKVKQGKFNEADIIGKRAQIEVVNDKGSSLRLTYV